MVPTNRTLLLLALGLPLSVVPTAFEPAAVVVLGAWVAWAIGVLVDVVALRRLELGVDIVTPRTVAVGGEACVEVTLRRNRGPWLAVALRTEVEPPLCDAPEARARVGSAAATFELLVRAERRGRAAVEAIWARIDGPLGLVASVRRETCVEPPIDIVPDVARVAEAVTARLGADPMLGGLRRDPWAGHGSEFESLQGYVLGMDPRSVDWKASARHQTLRVRRFHLERRQRVVVSLDTGRSMGDPIDGLDRLDHGVHTALALSRAALLAGDLVGLHAYATRPSAFVPAKAGLPQFQRLRRAAAELAVQDEETNHVLGLRDLATRLDRRSFVVVFTEFADVTTAELMIEVLGQIARRHLVVFVAIDDPATEAPLAEEPVDVLRVARAVVASSLTERRIEVLTKLSALGVHVIHSRPGLTAGRLLDRYLDVKRRGLLG